MNSVDYVTERIDDLRGQIFDMQAWAFHKGLDSAATKALINPYYDLISDIYNNDMPFAKTMDRSDLVIRAEGSRVRENATHINAVYTLFNKTRMEVHRLAKSIAGIADVRSPLTSDVDLMLTGTAPGSFIFGVALPPAVEPKQTSCLQEDPVRQAVMDALIDMSTLSLHVNSKVDMGGLREDIPDPGELDALMVSAVAMSPTGKSGIDGITLYSQKREYDRANPLTPTTRKIFREKVKSPITDKKVEGSFVGIVREIDLDAKRFEIRGVELAGEKGGIRCVFNKSHNIENILNMPLRVKGMYVTDKSGRPKLMEVDSIIPLPKAHQESFA